MQNTFKAFILISFTALTACSSTTWIVESENEVDRGDYKLLESELFIERTGTTSPELPIVQFQLKTANTIEYVERIKTNRYIQEYRPRFGYVVFGVGSAALAGYTALEFTDPQKSGQKIALLGASAALTGISFFNMKPSGEPQPTGESRLLRRTGKYIETDTLNASSNESQEVLYSLVFGNTELISSKRLEFSGNSFSINLLEELDPDSFQGIEEASVLLNVQYGDSRLSYSIPIRSVFEPFVEVTSAVTALRNAAELDSRNILTDLAQGSQLKLVSGEEEWFKVLYGISENWVSANDVNIIWRPTEFSDQLSVITIPNVPFGSVDVERGIPLLAEENRSKWAFIVSNQAYESGLPEKAYSHRDAELVQNYLNKAIGIIPAQTLSFQDVSGNQPIRNAFNRLTSRINNRQVELVVYLSGFAEVDRQTDRIYFLGTSDDKDAARIDLNSMFDGFANLPLTELTIIADISFINSEKDASALEVLAATVTTQIQNSVVVFASETGQQSYTYADPNGLQKRHSIFTYYFADALKNRFGDWEQIRAHLARNVSFTSRSIFNAAQDIRFFGNESLSLID